MSFFFPLNIHVQHCKNTYQTEYSNILNIHLNFQNMNPVLGCVWAYLFTPTHFPYPVFTQIAHSWSMSRSTKHTYKPWCKSVLWPYLLWGLIIINGNGLGVSHTQQNEFSQWLRVLFPALYLLKFQLKFLHHPDPVFRGYLHLWVTEESGVNKGVFLTKCCVKWS